MLLHYVNVPHNEGSSEYPIGLMHEYLEHCYIILVDVPHYLSVLAFLCTMPSCLNTAP